MAVVHYQTQADPITIGRRDGFTMIELVISIAILAILTSLAIVAGKAIFASQNRSSAHQQIALIADAIDRYASFWPKWKTGGVTVSDRGWPDPIAGRLFSPGAYQTINQFNDDLAFIVTDGIVQTTDLEERVVSGDVLSANVALAYSLTASTGRGPQLSSDDDEALLKDIAQILGNSANPFLPSRIGSNAAERAKVLVDPWGTPYRYFWIYRDTESNPSLRSYRGYLPVVTADVADVNYRKAEGYVLESAGPNRLFGNVWKINPTQQEIDDAVDNISILP